MILDLRTAVCNHVQKMRIAFFTQTRTGALVSRLSNDVIGAQQPFSGALSGVVTNFSPLVGRTRSTRFQVSDRFDSRCVFGITT